MINDLTHPAETESELYVLNSSLNLRQDAVKRAESAVQKAYRVVSNLPHLPYGLASDIEGSLLEVLISLNELRQEYSDDDRSRRVVRQTEENPDYPGECPSEEEDNELDMEEDFSDEKEARTSEREEAEGYLFGQTESFGKKDETGYF